MKWIALASIVFLLSACGCCINRDVVEYRQVNVAPVVVKPVYTAPVVRSVYVRPAPVTIVDVDPIDVTTTTIEYY